MHVLEQIAVGGLGVAPGDGGPQFDEAVIAEINDPVRESLDAIEAVVVPSELWRRAFLRGHLGEAESNPGWRVLVRQLGSHFALNPRVPVNPGSRCPRMQLGERDRLHQSVRRHRDGR